MKTVTVVLALLCVCPSLPAQNQAPQTLDDLRREIELALKQTGTPGAAVVLARNGQVEWVAAMGWADVAANRAMTPRTLMRIGSVSKEFVALAALKLQEQGRLRLTDPFQPWVPECPIENPWAAVDPLRLEQLLEFTSGVPEMDPHEFAHNEARPVTMAEALAFDPRNRHVLWRPGTRYGYSSYGIQLAAAVVEKAAGRRFEDYVRDEIFAPLGMTTAGYFLTPEAEPNLARTYRPDGRPVPYSHLVYRAAGAINASAEDMAAYLQFHLTRGSVDGRRLLSAESMDRLETPHTLPAVKVGVTTGYGLSNAAAFVKGHEMHGHRGEVDGAQTLFGYVPALGLGRVIMINSGNPWTMGRIRRLVDGYLERDFKSVEFPAPAKLPMSLLRELNGYYVNGRSNVGGLWGLAGYYGSLRKVVADPQGMTWFGVLPGGPAERWVAMGDKLFRRPEATKPALGLVPGVEGGPWLQNDYGTWEKIPALRVWLVVGGVVLALLLLGSSGVFALIWLPRRWLGRLPDAGPLSVRAAPLLGLAGLGALIGCHRVAALAGFAVLGTFNVWTAGVFLGSLLIPVAAILSGLAAWRHRHAPMSRLVYWHSVAVTVGLIWLTAFCLHWGLVGLRLWT